MREITKLPPLGRVSPELDAETQNFLGAVKQIIETWMGVRGSDYLDKPMTYRDAVDLGLITEDEIPRK